MPSRRLTKDEALKADALLASVKAMVTEAAGGDPVLLFGLRRRLFARLMVWERGTSGDRRRLQTLKWRAQNGRCAICGKPMKQKGAELDRTDALSGYTVENTRLVHHTCHRKDQEPKGSDDNRSDDRDGFEWRGSLRRAHSWRTLDLCNLHRRACAGAY